MKTQTVSHFEHVDLKRVRAVFVRGLTHRPLLQIPFCNRSLSRTLCVMGQNPSDASEDYADKTVRYLEHYVYERLPQYGAMLMLNLYARVDKHKLLDDVNHPQADRVLRCAIRKHHDFLFVFGKVKNEGKYRFPERLRELQPLFKGKNVMQFSIDADFPPHPGNSKILYRNLDLELKPFRFVT